MARATLARVDGHSPLITAAEIERAFPARIQAPPVTWWYRLALAGVAVCLILLQLVYVALIVGAVGATIGYLQVIPAILSLMRLNFVSVIVIVAPLAAGVITAFFLLKPLLARPPKPPENLALDRAAHPELHAWVEALCRCVGAPAPAVIEVSLDANASASLRRGLRSLFSDDLRLTLGLPLVNALTLRQFTGVLAHEFGHFSQKAGMRSWYLIQRVQMWFARVAYERDAWDLKLDAWRENSENNIVITVLWFANLAVSASRAVLRGLLYAARAVSAALSRQMEFDADHHEAALAGADTFEETMLALPTIGAAVAQGWRQVERGWQSRKLGADFPEMAHAYWRAMPGDVANAIRQATVEAPTGRFDTHPSHQQRVASVRLWNPPGVLVVAGPATRLFRDFASVCGEATRRHYEAVLGGDFKPDHLVAPSALIGDVERETAYDAARTQVLGGADPEWFQLEGDPWSAPLVASAALAVIASGTCQDAAPPEIDHEAYAQAIEKLVRHTAGALMVEMGMNLDLEAFRVPAGDVDTVRACAAESRASIAEVESEFRRALADPARRIRAAFDCLASEAVSVADPGVPDPREAWAGYQRTAALRERLWDLRLEMARYDAVRANLERFAAARAANALEDHEGRIRKATAEIAAALSLEPPDVSAWDAACWLRDEVNRVAYLALNRVCWIALQVEAAVRENRPVAAAIPPPAG